MRLCGLGSLTSASYSFGWKSGFQTRLHVLNKKTKIKQASKQPLPGAELEREMSFWRKGGEWLLRGLGSSLSSSFCRKGDGLQRGEAPAQLVW